ncbi:uncharacterized protein [Heptranchias perlo]|uniref:uncharacterized protein n=1 Tax=Heptranchias perlo TaxID=212740 RepID=UPI003559BDE2
MPVYTFQMLTLKSLQIFSATNNQKARFLSEKIELHVMYRDFFLIATFLLCFIADAATDETKNYSTIWKQAGDNVTLPCKYRWRSDQNSNLDIEWMIKSTDINKTDKMIATFSGGKVYTYSDLQQKISFSSENGSGGDTSLHIESLVVADSGIYHCKVKKEGTIYQEIFNLTVHDNQIAASVTPTIPVTQHNTTVYFSAWTPNSTLAPQNDSDSEKDNRAPYYMNAVQIGLGASGLVIILTFVLIAHLQHRKKAIFLHRVAVNIPEQPEDFLPQDDLQCTDQDVIYSTVQTPNQDVTYSTVQAPKQDIIYSIVQKHDRIQNCNENITYTPVQNLNAAPLPNTVIKQNPDVVYATLNKTNVALV